MTLTWYSVNKTNDTFMSITQHHHTTPRRDDLVVTSSFKAFSSSGGNPALFTIFTATCATQEEHITAGMAHRHFTREWTRAGFSQRTTHKKKKWYYAILGGTCAVRQTSASDETQYKGAEMNRAWFQPSIRRPTTHIMLMVTTNTQCRQRFKRKKVYVHKNQSTLSSRLLLQ